MASRSCRKIFQFLQQCRKVVMIKIHGKWIARFPGQFLDVSVVTVLESQAWGNQGDIHSFTHPWFHRVFKSLKILTAAQLCVELCTILNTVWREVTLFIAPIWSYRITGSGALTAMHRSSSLVEEVRISPIFLLFIQIIKTIIFIFRY